MQKDKKASYVASVDTDDASTPFPTLLADRGDILTWRLQDAYGEHGVWQSKFIRPDVFRDQCDDVCAANILSTCGDSDHLCLQQNGFPFARQTQTLISSGDEDDEDVTT